VRIFNHNHAPKEFVALLFNGTSPLSFTDPYALSQYAVGGFYMRFDGAKEGEAGCMAPIAPGAIAADGHQPKAWTARMGRQWAGRRCLEGEILRRAQEALIFNIHEQGR